MLKEAITAPYTIALRIDASDVSPTEARYPIIPPAKLSPAPVGVNYVCQRIRWCIEEGRFRDTDGTVPHLF